MPMIEVKKTPGSGINQISHAQGLVLEVVGNLAVVKLSAGTHVRVRTDMMPGKSDPPIAGERWILDQAYGSWRFAVPVAFQKVPIRRFTITIGDGLSSSFSIPHGLGSRDVLVQAYNPITGASLTLASTTRSDENTVAVTFSVAPAANAARIVVMG